MDQSMDRDLAEINFRPRNRGRKSYTRDSHGFELEKNYFQDASSDGESSSSSEGSFTLSLGKGTKQPRQQQTSSQQSITPKLLSGTRSDRSSHYSPSPLNTFNHSPAKVTTNPKKRLTFDMDSNEENRKHESESISESEEDGATVDEEVLPGSYSASGINPMSNRSVRHDGSTRKRSPVKASVKPLKQKSPAQAKPLTTSQARKPQKGHQKSSSQLAVATNNGKKRQTFDLGEFSTSSSDTDEEVEDIKRSLFVRPVGKEALMCLPKLSEYIKPRQQTIGGSKKEKQKAGTQQQNKKRKASNLNNVVATPTGAKRQRRNVHVSEKETTSVEESTATEDETAVRTERNPPRPSKKKRTSSVNVKPQSTSKKQKLVTNRASARRHGNRSSNSPVSDSSQKSFAVLHNTTSKIIDSIYGNDEQDVEENVRNEIEQNSSQHVTKYRPSISFTSKGEESRRIQNRKNKPAQNTDLSSVSDTKEVDVTLRQNRKRPSNSKDKKEESHGIEAVTENQKRKRRNSPKLLSSESEMSNGSTRITEQQPKKKKKGVTARQRPAKEVGISKNKEQLLQKDKEKKRPRGVKKRKLIDESKEKSQYVSIPLAKPQAMDDTLRRSSRTKVPPIHPILGERLVYETSPSGGLVVKEIIRPAELSSHLSTFEQKPKLVKKQNKQSSRNASQSHSSKSTSKITMAKEKERKDQNAVEEDTEELVEEKPARKPPHKASNPKKTLPSTDHTNTPVAMVDPITLDDSAHSKNASTNKRKVVTHNEQAERTLVLQPMSPKSKESFGNSLMKAMFQSESCLATESVEIIGDDGTARPAVEVIKPLQSLRLCNASGSMVSPNDPFIMAILSRQKNSNYGIAILNKMGDKGEQYTSDSSVCFFLIIGEIMVRIGDLELHPPVWSRIYIPEGVTYSLRNLQHTPAILSYMVTKPNKDHN